MSIELRLMWKKIQNYPLKVGKNSVFTKKPQLRHNHLYSVVSEYIPGFLLPLLKFTLKKNILKIFPSCEQLLHFLCFFFCLFFLYYRIALKLNGLKKQK